MQDVGDLQEQQVQQSDREEPTGDSIDPDESLFDRGVIDSLGIGSLVGILATRFGIVVADEDLLPDNFDSVSSIARYVNGKLGSDKRSQI